MSFVESDVHIKKPALSHSNFLLREMSSSPLYKSPKILVENVQTLAPGEPIPVGCSMHADVGQLPVAQVEDSYDRWERVVNRSCSHSGCEGNVCIRINHNARETGAPFHKVAINRQINRDGILTDGFEGELIFVYKHDTDREI